MTTTSTRLLALLALLTTRPCWSGPELAERLDVGVRTVRNDVARLRALGYPVESTTGRTGSYRLGAGGSLPPLLLDDDEAVAVAVGLRAAGGVAGVGQSSASALRKLEQVMPDRLRRELTALHESTVEGPRTTASTDPEPEVGADVLRTVSAAVRDRRCLRLDHGVDPASTELAPTPPLTVEPYRVVRWQQRWYLVAVELAGGSWQPLRLDRVRLRPPHGARFVPRTLPARPGVHAADDYAAFVVRQVASSGWAVHARIEVAAPAAEVIARVNPAVGAVEALDGERSVLVTGADSLEMVAVFVGLLDLDFRVLEPPALAEHLRALAARYARAAS
jgi:predicted DNA-binding transcriptional regulator YafY